MTAGSGRRLLLQAAVLAAVLVAWETLPARLGLTPLVLPRFSAVLAAAGEPLPGGAGLLPNLVVTTREILLAFALAAVLGVVTGTAMALSRPLEALLRPVLTALFAVPLITLIPLFLVAFGLGESSKIAFGALYAFFPVAFNTAVGVSSVEEIHLWVGRSFGLSRSARLRKIVLPGAARQIFGGLQMGLAISIVAVVSAEVFGSSAGLGYLLQRSAQSLMGAQTWFLVLITLALSYCLLLVLRLSARALRVRPESATW
jgi:NitT/TauT family transport system permease protein